MFKIGEFARISRVPAKTLRYYDEIGLLTPAQVDRFTGYRYYAADQLTRLNRILMLKDLGLSLEQISQLLDENLSNDQIRAMLRLKQTELHRDLKEGRDRLLRIEAHLLQIEREDIMPEITLKQLEPQTIISARKLIAAVEEMKPWFSQQFGAIYSFISQHGLEAGDCMALYHHFATDYRTEDIDTEAAVIVKSANLPTPPLGLQTRQLEGGQIASAIHKGDFDTITETYAALGKWIGSNGYEIAGASREIYLYTPPDVDHATYITEIQYPVVAHK